PKRAPGTEVTTTSARSSTVLMKCACPATRLHSAGMSSRTAWMSMVVLRVAARYGRAAGRVKAAWAAHGPACGPARQSRALLHPGPSRSRRRAPPGESERLARAEGEHRFAAPRARCD